MRRRPDIRRSDAPFGLITPRLAPWLDNLDDLVDQAVVAAHTERQSALDIEIPPVIECGDIDDGGLGCGGALDNLGDRRRTRHG